ncbi:MAG: hypothetical protein OXH07_11265 [Chloroflexi bacterium]|nr:hypothetical protein [Chloroflexota bacterium]
MNMSTGDQERERIRRAVDQVNDSTLTLADHRAVEAMYHLQSLIIAAAEAHRIPGAEAARILNAATDLAIAAASLGEELMSVSLKAVDVLVDEDRANRSIGFRLPTSGGQPS